MKYGDCPKRSKAHVQPFRIVSGMRICRVDGAKLRDIDTEFLLGTNGYASKYCPKDEIWVERTLAGKDLDAVIIHEVYEALLMSRGMKYEKAHKKALALERLYRKTGSLARLEQQQVLSFAADMMEVTDLEEDNGENVGSESKTGSDEDYDKQYDSEGREAEPLTAR